jgi:mono/diheme cytochrome c family protein
MKIIIWILALVLIASGVFLTGCRTNPKVITPETMKLTTEQLIQKGEYLVTISGCNDCHSPKQVGSQGPAIIQELMLSGYPASRPLPKIEAGIIKEGWILLNEDLTAAVGAWGISFAANLTSDQSGIGNWTEENFKRALKEGKFKGLEGTRSLLPPMPWTNFKTISDEDVKAMFAYLMNTKPVKNAVPAAIAPEEIK